LNWKAVTSYWWKISGKVRAKLEENLSWQCQKYQRDRIPETNDARLATEKERIRGTLAFRIRAMIGPRGTGYVNDCSTRDRR